jgi:hypothetical protein
VAWNKEGTPVETQRSAGERAIPFCTGRARKMIAHAIDYLSNEAARRITQGSRAVDDRAVADAISILMRCNRETYYSFPVKRTAWTEIQRVFHLTSRDNC